MALKLVHCTWHYPEKHRPRTTAKNGLTRSASTKQLSRPAATVSFSYTVHVMPYQAKRKMRIKRKGIEQRATLAKSGRRKDRPIHILGKTNCQLGLRRKKKEEKHETKTRENHALVDFFEPGTSRGI